MFRVHTFLISLKKSLLGVDRRSGKVLVQPPRSSPSKRVTHLGDCCRIICPAYASPVVPICIAIHVLMMSRSDLCLGHVEFSSSRKHGGHLDVSRGITMIVGQDYCRFKNSIHSTRVRKHQSCIMSVTASMKWW